MRNRHIVAYDVSDPARLRRVHRKMNGFGDALQYSVFACSPATCRPKNASYRNGAARQRAMPAMRHPVWRFAGYTP